MSKNKPTPSPQLPPQKISSRPYGARGNRPHLAIRLIVSGLVAWHVFALFMAPLSLPPTSPLILRMVQGTPEQASPMQWYLDALYMNQGHAFFAPEVGPGQLIRYELYDQSGRVFEQGELPSRKEHWPRLRYHRHFMLADQAGIPSDNPQYRDYWQRKYLESYANHLLRIHETAQSVRVMRFAHWPIPRHLVLEGRKLTDPEGYEKLLEVTLPRSALGPPEDERSQMRREPTTSTAQRWIGVPR